MLCRYSAVIWSRFASSIGDEAYASVGRRREVVSVRRAYQSRATNLLIICLCGAGSAAPTAMLNDLQTMQVAHLIARRLGEPQDRHFPARVAGRACEVAHCVARVGLRPVDEHAFGQRVQCVCIECCTCRLRLPHRFLRRRDLVQQFQSLGHGVGKLRTLASPNARCPNPHRPQQSRNREFRVGRRPTAIAGGCVKTP